MADNEYSSETTSQAFSARGEMVQPFPMSARDEIGQILMDIFGSLHEFMLVFGSLPTETGSRSEALPNAKHLGGVWTTAHIGDVIKTDAITSFSAFDHGMQLRHSLRDGNGSSSLATLALGRAEAMDRLQWLMTPQDPQGIG